MRGLKYLNCKIQIASAINTQKSGPKKVFSWAPMTYTIHLQKILSDVNKEQKSKFKKFNIGYGKIYVWDVCIVMEIVQRSGNDIYTGR